MLTSIIKQITQERHDDKSNANQLGTNQIHTLSNIRGFRKLGRNMTFGTYPYPRSVPVQQQPTKGVELVNSIYLLHEPKAPELEAPEEQEAQEAQEAAPEAQEVQEAPEPIPSPIPSPVIAPAREAPIPKGLSRAAMRKKQKEEEVARKRAQAQPSTPAPIEVASTLSE